ncbi:RNA-directed DNA polymerase, eukaryota, reverse transcriptase zinc-binding domain protein [Tanacetum coccineum]
MDQITSDMCKTCTGRLGYARVLIEISAEDEFIDKIEVNYVDEMKKVNSTKWVRVEYTWKPDRCSHCKVFGHSVMRCDAKPKLAPSNNIRVGKPGTADQEGFVEVRHKKNHNGIKKVWNNDSQGFKKQPSGVNMELIPTGDQQNVGKENVKELRKSANKYVVLSEEENHNDKDPFIDKRLIVDEFIKKKLQPACEEIKNWSYDMINYFKYKWEAIERKDVEMSDDEDVYDIDDQATQSFTANEIVGNGSGEEKEERSGGQNKTNDSFIQQFDKANGVFLPYLVYDHSPAIMSIPKGIPKKKKSFRFTNYVVDKEEFFDNIKEGWRHEMRGCHMYKVVQRLKLLKKPLNNLNWQNGNLFDRTAILKEKLNEAQDKLDSDPFNLAKKHGAVNLLNDYTKAAEEELKLLHQKAKIQWLRGGDKNSAYFHNILKSRKNKSRIESICCEDGSRVEGELVNDQFVKNSHNFLGTTFPVSPLHSMGDIVKLKLSEGEALDMIIEISDEEIKEALFDIDSSKNTGPDGFTSCFFKKAWGIIGNDICLAVKEFFTSGKILGEINATLIALVPKMDTPNKVSDFRPIACCNVLYKCIRKILTNRIKNGFSKVVSLNQSAFIPGRHIQDNILITQELLKGYNRKNGAKRCAMKIDIQKAYDTISWDFLKEVMLMVGFHETMVNWIMTCITSTSFSMCVNGEVNGFFNGRRGLRQGDPVFPYLFTLVMEAFNVTMIKNINDLMILCNGDTESLKVVKKSLDDFSEVSGLFPNLNKSTIFFGSISESLKEEMLQILPFKCGKLPMKYLGVPLLAKRLGVKDCQSLIDSVRNRINCWRNKFLSYAGRIQLIAFVLSAMHQYWAYVYMLPIVVTNEIEKLFKSFLWNPGGSARGKTKVAWKYVCRPKDQGGLVFKPMHKWNEVLIMSQLWKLIDKKESQCVKWVNTVKLKGKSIWEADIESNDSHGWKELMRIRDKIKPYVRFRIGDGKTISVWHDKWCDQGPLDKIVNNKDIYNVRMSNKTCLVDAIKDGRWKWADEWSTKYVKLKFLDFPLEKIKQVGLVKEIRLGNILLIMLG